MSMDIDTNSELGNISRSNINVMNENDKYYYVELLKENYLPCLNYGNSSLFIKHIFDLEAKHISAGTMCDEIYICYSRNSFPGYHSRMLKTDMLHFGFQLFLQSDMLYQNSQVDPENTRVVLRAFDDDFMPLPNKYAIAAGLNDIYYIFINRPNHKTKEEVYNDRLSSLGKIPTRNYKRKYLNN
jgi:hypothetical protein